MKTKAANTYTKNGTNFWRKCRSQKALISMIIPGVLIVFIFNYIPMYGILMAFQKYNAAAGIMGSEWVGLSYFKMFFENPFAWRLIKNTLLLGIYSLLWSFPFPIILALLLDQLPSQRFKRTVQTVSYFPYFISMVVVVGILQEFFAVDGVVNEIRTMLGAQAIPFLVEPKCFRSLYIGSSLWQTIGWNSIIYLAALSNVDPQLHEAAIMDGANRWQRVLYISWPTIIPTTTIMLIFAVSGILGNDYQKILLMYNESTYEVADVINTYVYREGIAGGRIEYTTAIGLMMNVVSFVLLFLTNQISKTVSENSLW